MLYLLTTLLYLMASVTLAFPEERRDPKWFFSRRTLTSVLMQRRLVTEMIPSSCATVEPTLSPCRNVRRMDIKPSPPRKVLLATDLPTLGSQIQNHNVITNKKADALEPSSDGGNWLWGGVVTVTQVLVSDVTVKIPDPNTVITFSVKGCRPTRLPFDLPYCNNSTQIPINSTANIPVQNLRTADLHYVED